MLAIRSRSGGDGNNDYGRIVQCFRMSAPCIYRFWYRQTPYIGNPIQLDFNFQSTSLNVCLTIMQPTYIYIDIIFDIVPIYNNIIYLYSILYISESIAQFAHFAWPLPQLLAAVAEYTTEQIVLSIRTFVCITSELFIYASDTWWCYTRCVPHIYYNTATDNQR